MLLNSLNFLVMFTTLIVRVTLISCFFCILKFMKLTCHQKFLVTRWQKKGFSEGFRTITLWQYNFDPGEVLCPAVFTKIKGLLGLLSHASLENLCRTILFCICHNADDQIFLLREVAKKEENSLSYQTHAEHFLRG